MAGEESFGECVKSRVVTLTLVSYYRWLDCTLHPLNSRHPMGILMKKCFRLVIQTMRKPIFFLCPSLSR